MTEEERERRARKNRKNRERLIRKYGQAAVNKRRNRTYIVKNKILKDRTHGFCKICRFEFPREELTVDHIVQLSQGGTHDKTNLQLICLGCHRLKDYENGITLHLQ